MKAAAAAEETPLSALLGRGLGLLLLWLILIGPALGDLPVGLAASAAGVWASTWLWPPDGKLSGLGIVRFVIRFLPQSVAAGLEVARRAFAPTPDLQPGFTTCRSTIPAGLARDSACAVMSLQPGKLPISADADGTLLIHCLDIREAVAEQIADDEMSFRRILQQGRADA